MAYSYVVLDVFTNRVLSGNPLAVVLDADGLDEERMLAIAKAFNLSETVFVLKPTNPAHSARLRIFTPGGEVPFAGHPTIGTAILLAKRRLGEVDQEQDIITVLEEEIGILRCGVVLRADGTAYAEFDSPKLAAKDGEAPDRDIIAAALGLTKLEIGFENHKTSRFEAGLSFTFVPVNGLDAIAKIRIDRSLWGDAFGVDQRQLAYVYCRDAVQHDCQFHARMFAPMIGIDEDPATGSAAADFAGVVKYFDELRDGTHEVRIEQGVEMGRPSLIRLEIDIEGGAMHAVRIGGEAVIFAEGTLAV